MKKIICFMLACVVVLSSCFPVFASSNSKPEYDTSGFTPLTEEQAIQKLSEIEGISIEEATIRLKGDTNSNKINGLKRSGETTYGTWSQTYDEGAGVVMELGALCKIGCGQYNEFISVESKWAKLISSGPQTYDSFYVQAEILNIGQLQLGTRGNIEVVVNTSLSGSGTYQNLLTGCGFSVSTTVGSNVYYRKVVEHREVKSMSWWRG